MFSENILLTFQNLGFKVISFFTWLFDYLNQPIPLLLNASIIEVALSSAITFFLVKGVVDAIFGGIVPGD